MSPSIRLILLASALGPGPLAFGCSGSTQEPVKTTVGATDLGPNTSSTLDSSTGVTGDLTMATGTAETSDSSTAEPCNLLGCADQGGHEHGECDNWAQDCPDGQKCIVYISGGTWDATRCVDVTGQDKPGDPCISEGAFSGVDSCIKGAMCWYLDGAGSGICVAMCTGNSDAPKCPAPAICTIAGQGTLNLCLGCDPLLQDCIDPTTACYPIDSGFSCFPDLSGEGGQANAPCSFVDACDKGLMCADVAVVGMGCQAESSGCCTPFCKFPDGACPNPDQQCLQYFDPAQLPPNDPLLDIGICGLPG